MISRLSKSIREFKLPTLLSPLFVAIEVFLEVLIPTFTANIINVINTPEGDGADKMNTVVTQGLLLIAMAALSLIFGALSGIFASKASCGFARNLRSDMYDRIQSFSFANIDHFSTAGLVTRITTDITYVQNSFQMIIRIAIRAPIMLIFALVMTFRIDSRISIIYLVVLPILAGGIALLVRYGYPIFMHAFKLYDRLNQVVQENLRGIRVVKSFVREDHEKKKFGDVSEDVYSDFSRAESLLALSSPIMQFCANLCMILVAWMAAQFIVRGDGDMQVGDITALTSYTMQMLMSLMMLSVVFVMIVISKAPAERICEVLKEEYDIVDPAEPVCEVRDGSITFRSVDFSYAKDSERLCLRDVDLSIRSGETIGIIGSTGSSKTTLVQLIPRLYDATGGSVLVGRVDVRDYSLRTLRNSVAMVLQKNELFSGTVKDNLRWGNEGASDEELVRVCKLAQADGFISAFPEGYDTHIEQGGANVSGGQKQRLCIARALLKKPRILILDDSTSAVDTATDALIRKAFAEEIPDTTKIIIAQRVASVQDADRIVVMDGGRIVSVGTHDELMNSSDIYREVYTSQLKGGADDE